MNKRLEQFIAAVNISQAQLAETLGVARGSISHLIQGRNKPGFDFLTAMMEKFPDLNIEWLMRGTGTMFKSLSSAPVKTNASVPVQSGATVPVQTSAAAGTDDPDLFSSFLAPEPTVSLPESDISVQVITPASNIAASERKDTPISIVQHAVKQKVITKILVFFDDNSFQELEVK